jgi:diadenosine tetraphosphate (Ap4A) HIT family hydrolase
MEMAEEKMDHPVDAECLFCRWIKGAGATATFGSVAAFEDGFPVTPGHLLIVPLRHVPDCFSMTRQEVCDSLTLIRKLVEKIKQEDPSVTGCNIGTNAGVSAGQTIAHAHIHLIPRRDGDTRDPKGGVRGVIDGRRGY